MAKENFTYRISSELKDELEALAAKCSGLEGRRVSLTEIIDRAIAYGKPFVKTDAGIAITLPRTARSEKERVMSVAMQAVQIGFEHLQPGEAAQ